MKKANISSAPEKNISVCFQICPCSTTSVQGLERVDQTRWASSDGLHRHRTFAPKRYQAPRRSSYAKAPPRKRQMPASGRSFAVSMKKASISSVLEKNMSVCFLDMPLLHNKWSKGFNVLIKHFRSPVLSFENMNVDQITRYHRRKKHENVLARE